MEAEHVAEIDSEMKRVDQDPDQVRVGGEDLGTQSADSGTPRDEEEPAGKHCRTESREDRGALERATTGTMSRD